MPSLFDPLQLGDIELATRVVMAPLTRNRAGPGEVPTELMATYYAQRADPATGAGLIVSEATQISPQGRGYAHAPGIHSAAQVAGWRRVTRAVHERGGRIVLQLWHVGRQSHTSLQPDGAAPVSSTATPSGGRAWGHDGPVACSVPRPLRDDEIPGLVADYARAAVHAREAGFDGVEVHGANGYLLEQFLRDTINDRSGPYGGPVANRARLLIEVVQAVAAAIGAGRTGLRVSPQSPLATAGPDSQAALLMQHVAESLAPLKLAYVHFIEGQTGGTRDSPVAIDLAALRAAWGAGWMLNNGYTRELALAAVAEGRADAVAFGKPFIANPDLGARLRSGAPWAQPDPKLYYSPGAAGYTDYPPLAA